MVPPCIPMLYAAAARRAVHETKEKGICNPFSQTTLYSVFISAVLGRVRRCGRTIYKFVIIDRSSRASERCTHKTQRRAAAAAAPYRPNPKPQTANRKPQNAFRISHFALRISAHFRVSAFLFDGFLFLFGGQNDERSKSSVSARLRPTQSFHSAVQSFTVLPIIQSERSLKRRLFWWKSGDFPSQRGCLESHSISRFTQSSEWVGRLKSVV